MARAKSGDHGGIQAGQIVENNKLSTSLIQSGSATGIMSSQQHKIPSSMPGLQRPGDSSQAYYVEFNLK